MQSAAHREPSAPHEADQNVTPAPATTVAVAVHDGVVCVAVVKTPARATSDGVCRCAACHGALQRDWADRFL